MAFSLVNLTDPAVWLGASTGGGVLGFISGQVKVRSKKISILEKEVEACRERDAQVIVLTSCFRALWGEQMRREPNNPVLKMCGDLLATKLPITPEERKLDGFKDLMDALNMIPATGEVNRGRTT